MPRLNGVFGQMADETPPSTGQEIGAALSQALGQAFLGLERSQERLLGGVERSQEALARLLAAALAEAARCEAPPNAPPGAQRPTPLALQRGARRQGPDDRGGGARRVRGA